jgi:hypothetical protein
MDRFAPSRYLGSQVDEFGLCPNNVPADLAGAVAAPLSNVVAGLSGGQTAPLSVGAAVCLFLAEGIAGVM